MKPEQFWHTSAVMKNVILALSFLLFVTVTSAATKCNTAVKMSPDVEAKLLEIWKIVNGEATEASQKEREVQYAASVKRNEESAKKDAEIKAALKAVKSFDDFVGLSAEAKLEVVKWYGRKDMSSYKTKVVSKDLGSIQDAQQKAYLKKALKAVEEEGGFEYSDHRGNEISTIGDVEQAVTFVLSKDGRILGADIRAMQKIVYTGGDNGAALHFTSEKAAKKAGFEWGTENYRGNAYLDENAQMISFEQMSYDH